MVVVPTFLDPLLQLSDQYKNRYYPYSFWLVIYAIPVFCLTYCAMTIASRLVHKILWSWIPFVVCGVVALKEFGPPYPHGFIGGSILMYSVASVITVWINGALNKSELIADSNIAIEARIESIKSTFSICLAITVGLAAGYFSLLVPWIKNIFEANNLLIKDDNLRALLNFHSLLQIIIFSIYFLIGPLKESLVKTIKISHWYLNIKSSK